MPTKRKSHKPPFRKGLDPLFEAGLIEKISDPLAKFLWFCESVYLDNFLLRSKLESLGIDVHAVLHSRRPFLTTPGSPGHHRKEFDRWYRQIARDQQAKRIFREHPAGKGRVH